MARFNTQVLPVGRHCQLETEPSSANCFLKIQRGDFVVQRPSAYLPGGAIEKPLPGGMNIRSSQGLTVLFRLLSQICHLHPVQGS